MLASAGRLGFLALGLVLAGVGLLVFYGVSYADETQWMNHGTDANAGPYWPRAAIVANNYTGYAAEHQEAMDRWNTALPRDYLLQWDPPGGFPLRQYMVYTSSQWDLDIANLLGADSCQDYLDTFPVLGAYRAFEFGHTPQFGDKMFTVICINHSAYVNCSNCFDDVATEMQIKGIVHEMGHALHLRHPCVKDSNGDCEEPETEYAKGAMYTGWNQAIIQQEVDYIHFAYAVATVATGSVTLWTYRARVQATTTA